ncbi:NAD(P)H-dependent oxidoreductase [Cupriavidus basilensis]|uniref:NAD(P)H-dependent oxidoreductase n=1 Tax=Cupriavidus basilensis TaxID=68895 RepID=UPI0023E83BF8|nr:NAD(P)H-dependent oxidoreductase [Cupriavidus basilensis]MDF3883015.1 NAD(P)H-dependent oxidoreductase [Cupriavidus basilensis]
MNALIVLAHPEPTSFSAALKDVAAAALREEGYAVTVSNLYAEQFNPVAGRHDFESVCDADRFHYQQEQLHAAQHGAFAADIVREQRRVAEADLFVFVYPLWWGGMPAILKGWFERVLAYGFAYADGQRFDRGYFKGRHGIEAISTGGTRERFSAEGVYGDIDTLLYPHRRCMLEYVGLATAPTFVAYAAPRVSDDVRRQYLEDWARQVRAVAGLAHLSASSADHPARAPARIPDVKAWAQAN